MSEENQDKETSEDEIAKRRDEAIRRALNTPPKPKLKGKSKPPPTSPKSKSDKGAK